MTRPFASKSLWLPIGLCALIGAAYANSLSGDFLFDDYPVLLRNPHLHVVWPPWESGQSPYRIVVSWSFAVNHAFFGQSAPGYHLGNMLVHIGAALALYGLVRLTLGLAGMPGSIRTRAPLLAFASAAVWGIHPLTTQAVTYISQRYESMMGMFYLVTLYAFARGASDSSRRWHLAAVAACALGMCCKRVMITAPIVVLIYDWIFLAQRNVKAMRPRALWHALLFLTAAVPYLLDPLVPAESETTALVFTPLGIPPMVYAMTQLQVVAHYIRLAFWPVGQCFDYAWPAASSVSEVVMPGLLLLVLVGCTVAGLWHYPRAAFIGVCFFGILAPTSTIVPIDDLAVEHRVYLSLAALATGFVLAVDLACSRIAGAANGRRAAGIVACAAIVALGTGTHFRNRVYESSLRMWQDILAKRPGNVRAYSGVAAGLLRSGDAAAAIPVAENGLRRLPDLHDFNYSLDMRGTLARKQRGDVTEFIRLQGYLGTAYTVLRDPVRAEQHHRVALSAFPGHVPSRVNLGLALIAQERFGEARREFERVLESSPDHAGALQHLAWLDTRPAEPEHPRSD